MLEDSDNISFDGQNVSGNDLDLLGQLQNLNINNENSEGTNQASNKVLLKSNPVFDKAIASTKVINIIYYIAFLLFRYNVFVFRLKSFLRFWSRKSYHLKKRQLWYLNSNRI